MCAGGAGEGEKEGRERGREGGRGEEGGMMCVHVRVCNIHIDGCSEGQKDCAD